MSKLYSVRLNDEIEIPGIGNFTLREDTKGIRWALTDAEVKIVGQLSNPPRTLLKIKRDGVTYDATFEVYNDPSPSIPPIAYLRVDLKEEKEEVEPKGFLDRKVVVEYQIMERLPEEHWYKVAKRLFAMYPSYEIYLIDKRGITRVLKYDEFKDGVELEKFDFTYLIKGEGLDLIIERYDGEGQLLEIIDPADGILPSDFISVAICIIDQTPIKSIRLPEVMKYFFDKWFE